MRDLQPCNKRDHFDGWSKRLLAVSYNTYRCVCIAASAGGISVLLGARFFAANRVNIGKFHVIVGTGQGLFTIAIRILRDMDRTDMGIDNYITWLTTSAIALGILFAVLSASISKGKGQSISSKAVRFALRRRINSDP